MQLQVLGGFGPEGKIVKYIQLYGLYIYNFNKKQNKCKTSIWRIQKQPRFHLLLILQDAFLPFDKTFLNFEDPEGKNWLQLIFR